MRPGWTLMALLLTAAPGFSQGEAKKYQFYRLDFTVKELEGGKAVNSRAYTLIEQISSVWSIKAGDKVPVPTEKGQWTFIDVGVNIDARGIMQVGNEISMSVSADISSVASAGANGAPPLLRQTRWNSTVTIPVRKAVTIFSSDSVTDKRQTQLEVTATPMP